MHSTNFFDFIPPVIDEDFKILLEHRGVTISRIVSSQKIDSKIYIQNEDEWVLLLDGEALILVDKVEHILKKGDMMLIVAHTPHQILSVKDGTIWLTVHFGNEKH